jgi:5'(3')-deoxyribonucleotidase
VITTIYLDVDEVLANWVGAALRLLAYDETKVHVNWNLRTPRPWDLFDVLGMSTEAAWQRIHEAGASFWAEIERFSWAQELVALCESQAPTTLLTSASAHPSSFAGKAQWIAEHLPGMPHAIMRGCKSIHAHPGALLIDDSPKNCDAFRNPPSGKPGGHAILFPGVGNDLHALRHDPLPYVREQLAAFNR